MWVIPTTFKELAPMLRYALLVVVALYAMTQVKKPSKWVGRFFVWLMNLSHSNLTDWGLTHMPIEKDFTILDVGCGGGRTIQKLAAATQGTVYGVDYANGSVAASRAKNAQLVEEGRVEIKHASVSQLPFPDKKFDLVTAVETQYYWPDLPNDMREILRVLKPGGTLIIIAESYKHGKHDAWKRPVMKLLKSTSLGVDDQRALFSSAGYADVEVFEDARRAGFVLQARSPPILVTRDKRNRKVESTCTINAFIGTYGLDVLASSLLVFSRYGPLSLDGPGLRIAHTRCHFQRESFIQQLKCLARSGHAFRCHFSCDTILEHANSLRSRRWSRRVAEVGQRVAHAGARGRSG
jgi:SAM-dependent methyltransferase